MKLVDSMLSFLKSKDTTETQTVPAGMCPNCWGRDEYEGQFYDRVKQENQDVNSNNPNLGWVADYANKHLTGISLQPKGDELVCERCQTGYKLIEVKN